ncbi:MAG: thiamine diphosphokinase [Rhodobacteraceae bacterium]|nr:thiamine diphosphokinase [Paracoccaceae bacterium]
MPAGIVRTSAPVTLLGAGRVSPALVKAALRHAPVLVAADGGANMAARMGLRPVAVIGDMDSAAPEVLAGLPAGAALAVSEQDTTDFEKALARLAVPWILGVGFTGARIDHALAVMNALVRHRGPPCLILSEADVILAARGALSLPLRPGTRVSLFPMAPVRGRSEGLRWPIGGLDFAPDGLTGTSNEATGPVRMEFDGPGMLVILPRACLGLAIAASVPG